jgi:hypothetical protein
MSGLPPSPSLFANQQLGRRHFITLDSLTGSPHSAGLGYFQPAIVCDLNI